MQEPVAQCFGFGFGQLGCQCEQPQPRDEVCADRRLGLAISLVLTLVAEMVGNPAGLGFALVQAAQALQPAQMFAYIVAIGVSGIILNGCLMGAARLLFAGQMASAGESS